MRFAQDQDRLRVGEVMQHLRAGDDVHAVVRERERECIADLGVAEVGAGIRLERRVRPWIVQDLAPTTARGDEESHQRRSRRRTGATTNVLSARMGILGVREGHPESTPSWLPRGLLR